MPHRNRKQAAPPGKDVRIGPLRHIAGVLREAGCDPAAALAEFRLAVDAFDDPERRIPFSVAAGLIGRCVALSGREDFGLQVGDRFSLIDDFGLLGQLIWRAPTVGAALQELNRYLYVQDRGAITYLRTSPDGVAALGYSILDPQAPATATVYDLVMALALRLMQALAGPRFRPAEVWLAHGAPRRRVPYTRLFAAPLRFDAPRSELQFAAYWLQAPVFGADEMQHALVERAIRVDAAGLLPGLVERTRAVVQALLLVGDASAARIAGALGMHERTLRRRLTAAGASLQGVVAEQRFELACQLLHDTQLGMGEIAAVLGYAEASVFVRAFRNWAGCPPGQWRAHGLRAALPAAR